MMNQNNQTLRKTILAARDKISSVEQTEKSKKILSFLLELPEIKKAETLFVYVNFRSEVQTIPFIRQCVQQGKIVAVPVTRVTEKKLQAVRITDPEIDLLPGYCGIPEPGVHLQQSMMVRSDSIDVVILPGSVFDRRGGRLGYGGGYYDRFLALSAPQATRVALAYEAQVVDTIDLQPHDQLMDWLITEKSRYQCRRK